MSETHAAAAVVEKQPTATATTETKGAADKAASVASDKGSGGTKATADTKATGADKAAATATLLDAGDAAADAAEKQVVPADWPEDWRDKLAKGKADRLKWLKRYTSLDNVLDAHDALRQRVSAGELKAVTQFPAEGTDEQKAEWRKQNGIPDKAEGYEPKVEGLVFGDADKPMLDSFQAHAHGKNWTPAQFNDALSWYAAEQQQMAARQAEADASFRETARDALYSKWGAGDFRKNINAVNNLLETAPAGFKERLLGARLADGKLLGDDPGALDWLSGLSREMNPAATLVPAGNGAPGKGVEARLEEIRTIAREQPDKYDRKLEAEQIELLAAQEKMQARGRAA